MCDKAVDACLPALKFIPDWFFINKMLEKLDDIIFFNDNIVFVNTDSDNVTFFSDAMGLNTIDLNNINLNDRNFDENDPENIRHMVRCNRYKQCKACKKEISKYLMTVACHPTRW